MTATFGRLVGRNGSLHRGGDGRSPAATGVGTVGAHQYRELCLEVFCVINFYSGKI